LGSERRRRPPRPRLELSRLAAPIAPDAAIGMQAAGWRRKI
jgi:hypothetical protein